MTVSHVRESLDGASLLTWARTCRTDLELRRAEIDALNVFPIADADTGTNLLATMRAAVSAAESVASGPVPVVAPADAGRVTPEPITTSVAEPAAVSGDGRIGTEGDLRARVPAGGAGHGAPDGEAAGPEVAGLGAVPSAYRIARALARGATSGARGNSGIILSQVLRGIADAVVDGPLTGQRLRVALRRAAMLVRTGLSAPVEGTILTVLDRAAVAADDADDLSLVTVARAAADGAARALNETPTQLGVLRAAGVVDAGARGLLVLLDCLVAAVCGQAPTRDTYARKRADIGTDRLAPETSVRPAPTTAADRIALRPGSPVRPGDVQRLGGVGRLDDRALPADLTRSADVEGSGDLVRPGDVGRPGADDCDHPLPERTPDPHFEVMYLISGSDEDAARGLRDRLAVLGDSVVVVGDGDGTWSAHVHCRDAGAAIEAGLVIGRVSGIRIESFAVTAPHGGHHEDALMSAGTVRDAVGHPGESARADRPRYAGEPLGSDPPHDRSSTDGFPHLNPQLGADAPAVTPGEADRGVLAVVSGDEAARLFADAGAVVLRGDRQFDANSLLRAIRAMPHREVLVLPNGALPAQELVAVGVAARDASRDVLLLPSASMVQGLAALAVHDRGRIAVDDAFAMSEAAATTRWGALRAARVRALTMVGTCAPGDGLGLVGQDVVVIDPDVVGAGKILLDRMLGLGGELVTLLMGADAGPELGQVLTDHVTAGFPGVEVVVYSGGQQADLVQIGVE
ncbi:DAK2 domain-containing protein [Nocardia sp. AG03]|uniref:DAK2 domain-containing protein n=1 Tax=Nocardia sp. AG03 TaxID=3025312 RepID=UPI0024186DF3|nr:DAK2 domain-containing protein [Nocardia sp. AG03]